MDSLFGQFGHFSLLHNNCKFLTVKYIFPFLHQTTFSSWLNKSFLECMKNQQSNSVRWKWSQRKLTTTAPTTCHFFVCSLFEERRQWYKTITSQLHCQNIVGPVLFIMCQHKVEMLFGHCLHFRFEGPLTGALSILLYYSNYNAYSVVVHIGKGYKLKGQNNNRKV